MYSKKTQLANRTETKSHHNLNLQLLAPGHLNKDSGKRKKENMALSGHTYCQQIERCWVSEASAL